MGLTSEKMCLVLGWVVCKVVMWYYFPHPAPPSPAAFTSFLMALYVFFICQSSGAAGEPVTPLWGCGGQVQRLRQTLWLMRTPYTLPLLPPVPFSPKCSTTRHFPCVCLSVSHSVFRDTSLSWVHFIPVKCDGLSWCLFYLCVLASCSFSVVCASSKGHPVVCILLLLFQLHLMPAKLVYYNGQLYNLRNQQAIPLLGDGFSRLP